MAWDSVKITGDTLTADEYNTHVTDQKSRVLKAGDTVTSTLNINPATDVTALVLGTNGATLAKTLEIGVGTGVSTIGINFATTTTATTGISIQPSVCTTGISIGLTGKTYTSGIIASVTGSTITTGISLVGTSTTGISMTGAITTGLEMTGAMTTGINVAPSAATTGVSVGVTGKTYATGVALGVTGGILTTGISMLGTTTTAISIQSAMTTGITVGLTGARISLAATANRLFELYATSALTADISTTMTVSQTQTVASTSGAIEVARFELKSEYKTGVYTNALMAQIDYGVAGYVHGLAGVVCAELSMPSGGVSPVGGQGTYSLFEAEIDCPTGYLGGVPISVIRIGTWGGAQDHFDTDGYLFDIDGVNDVHGGFWHDHQTATPVNVEEWLRVRTPSGDRFLPLYHIA